MRATMLSNHLKERIFRAIMKDLPKLLHSDWSSHGLLPASHLACESTQSPANTLCNHFCRTFLCRETKTLSSTLLLRAARREPDVLI